MADNKITDTIKMVAGEDEEEVEVGQPAQNIVFDSSTPPVRSIVRVVLVTLLILAVAGFLTNLISALTYLFFMIVLSVFFAYLIKPLVELIRRPFENTPQDKYMPRPLAIATAYLIVFLTLGVSIAVLTPLVVEQARQFSISLPEYASSLQTGFRDLSTRFRSYQIPETVQTQINEKATSVVGAIGSEITNFLIALIYYVPWLILVPILAFFFLKDANLFRVSVLRVFPSGDWRARMESIIHDVNTTLAAYVRAQLISCVLIGTLCTVAFYVLGVNYALLLGVLAGIFEFIPLLGPLTIAVIVITVAALESTWEAIYVAIFLGVLRVVHDYVTYPRIVREGIHLHPLAVILSVLAGEQVAGIPGVFLAIPIVALLTVLYKHILEHSKSKGIVANMLAPVNNEEEAKNCKQ
ncbi:MAG: AI-2E family transporter [Acidobacteria bacterium]|jgi:predicted PurR-regulated permease PerM|nr:AI-2E family transporter [Acidobacteriota bacterium]